MDITIALLQQAGAASLQLLEQPFYYIAVLLLIFFYNKQIQMERKLFSTKLHSLLGETWTSIAGGWLVGIAATVLMGLVGAMITVETVYAIWVIMAVLVWFRLRFLSFSYVVGVYGVIIGLISIFPVLQEKWGDTWIRFVFELNMAPLLVLAGLLYILQGVLVRKQLSRSASPMLYTSKRGKIIGGYEMKKFWPVPLFLLVPASSGSESLLPWTPMLGGEVWLTGWSLIAFPIILGFTDRTTTVLPAVKARLSSGLLAAYGGVLLLLAIGVQLLPILTIVTSILTIVLHEALIRYSEWQETLKRSIFVQEGNGLIILAVIPGKSADQLNIQAGETLYKVNGVRVNNQTELHEAFSMNPASCRLEVLNLQGESKFVQRAVFSDDHHQLGLVFAPDDAAVMHLDGSGHHFSLWHYLGFKWTGIKRKSDQSASV